MWQRLYIIYDVRAELTLGPLQAHNNDASAIRMFNDIARAENNAVHEHLEDFNLVYVGEFNTESGELHSPGINLGYPIDHDSCIILKGATLAEVTNVRTQTGQGTGSWTDAAETAAEMTNHAR